MKTHIISLVMSILTIMIIISLSISIRLSVKMKDVYKLRCGYNILKLELQELKKDYDDIGWINCDHYEDTIVVIDTNFYQTWYRISFKTDSLKFDN